MRDKTRGQVSEQLPSDEKVHARLVLRAHEIYEQRGCERGCELDDWLQAESEILPLLIEQELQRGPETQAALDEVKTERPASAEEKPAKKAAGFFKRNRPTSERSAIGSEEGVDHE